MKHSYLIVCVIIIIASSTINLGVGTSSSSSPRDNLRNWVKVYYAVKGPMVQEKGQPCSAPHDLSVSWGWLEQLMIRKSRSGILRYAWPRMDSFYSEALKPILSADPNSLMNGTLSLCGTIDNDYQTLVCDQGTCLPCKREPLKDHELDKPDTNSVCWDLRSKDKGPEGAKVNRDKLRELKRDVSAPDPTPNPGTPSPTELASWMTSKFERKEGITGHKDGDCYASVKLMNSLRYLRVWFFDAGKRTVDQVQAELSGTPEFYWHNLRWLSGVTPDSRTICGDGLFCGREGICVDCKDFDDSTPDGYKAGYTNEDRLLLMAVCVDSVMRQPDHDRYKPLTPTTYKSSRDAFRKWFAAAESIGRNAAKKSNDSCSASVEQSLSYTHLVEVFAVDLKRKGSYKPKNIMEWAWPRIPAYEEALKDVLADGVPQSVRFCSWSDTTDQKKLLCMDGSCVACSDIPMWVDAPFKSYYKKCTRTLDGPSTSGEFSEIRYLESQGVIVGLDSLPEDFPGERISTQDASRWNESFASRTTLGKLEDCDAPAELTLSQKFLLRKWSLEMSEKESQEELKWLLGEDMENGRKLCGSGLLCAPEGICVPCGLTTMRVKELDRVCEEFGEKEFYVDLETIIRTTTEKAFFTTQGEAGETGGGGVVSTTRISSLVAVLVMEF